jgi:hypothetical protein
MRWYQSITELPLSKFIECAVDGNLNALVISGDPDERLLYLAWLNIRSEYADAIGSRKHKVYVRLFRDVSALSITLELVNNIVEMLETVYSGELVTRLNGLLGTTLVFDTTDHKRYNATLRAAVMRAKAIKINLEIKERQLQAMKGADESGAFKETREYYQSYLITLSNHVKYNISSDITVFEYCERLRRYVNDCERLKKAKNVR